MEGTGGLAAVSVDISLWLALLLLVVVGLLGWKAWAYVLALFR